MATSGPLVPLLRLVVPVAAAALLLRLFVAQPFAIPSPSMLPGLWAGDLLLGWKWPLRAGGEAVHPGDVVIVDGPPGSPTRFIKRVIAVGGDRVALRGGRVVLNGVVLPRLRVADMHLPVSANQPCPVAPAEGGCRLPRWRETLPDGRSHIILDLGETPLDDMTERRVRAGHLFLLGDNRDRSRDSRVAPSAGGLGMVPAEAVVARAGPILWSADGSARWSRPGGWAAAVRWDRIGQAPGLAAPDRGR